MDLIHSPVVCSMLYLYTNSVFHGVSVAERFECVNTNVHSASSEMRATGPLTMHIYIHWHNIIFKFFPLFFVAATIVCLVCVSLNIAHRIHLCILFSSEKLFFFKSNNIFLFFSAKEEKTHMRQLLLVKIKITICVCAMCMRACVCVLIILNSFDCNLAL